MTKDREESRVKQLIAWFSNATVATKTVIIGALLFIALNAAFSLYAGTYLIYKGGNKAHTDTISPIDTNNETDPFGRPQKTLKAKEYERVFMEDYNKWEGIIDTLLYRIKDRSKVETAWDDELAQQVTQMNALIQRAQIIIAPDEYSRAHENYMNAINEFSYTSANLESSIRDKDIKMLDESMKKLVRGSSYLNRALNQLRQTR